MGLPQKLLSIICCPATHQLLREINEEELQVINEKIAQGGMQQVNGESVSSCIDGGLLREDSRVLYPVRGEIPVLLQDEGLSVPAGLLPH